MLKQSQTGASALLGFLQSLQQGNAQRNQQREQKLASDIQLAEADKSFQLQKTAADLQAEAARRQQEKDKLNAPGEALVRQQTLDAPNQQAFADWNTGTATHATALSNAAKLRLEAATTRDPNKARLLLDEATRLQTSADQSLANLKSNISGRVGLTRFPWEPPIGPADRFAAGMAGGVMSGLGIGGAISQMALGGPMQQNITGTQQQGGMGGQQGGMTGQQGGMGGQTGTTPTSVPVKKPGTGLLSTDLPDPSSIPLTVEEMKLLDEKFGGTNLGALLSPDYYDMPIKGVRTLENGNLVNFGPALYIRNPTRFGADLNKFVKNNEQVIGEAVLDVLGAGAGQYIPERTVLTHYFGKDESLWPVEEKGGQYVPRTNWFGSLSDDKKQRVVGRLSKFIAPTKDTVAEVGQARELAIKGIESEIENEKELRKRRWANSDRLFDAQLQKELVKARGANQRVPTDPVVTYQLGMASATVKSAYDDAKDNLDNFKTLSVADVKQPDTMASLLNIPATTLTGIDLSTVTRLFATAATEGEKLLTNIIKTNKNFNPDNAAAIAGRYNNVPSEALRVAATKLITQKQNERATAVLPEVKAQIDRDIKWVALRAGLPVPE